MYFIINEDRKNGYLSFEDEKVPVLSMNYSTFEGSIDKGVATTVRFLEKHRNVRDSYYLVQNYETGFMSQKQSFTIEASKHIILNFI